MTIKELIKKLKTYDKQSEVLLSRDEEGNAFGTINEHSFNYKYGILVIFPWTTYTELDEAIKESNKHRYKDK